MMGTAPLLSYLSCGDSSCGAWVGRLASSYIKVVPGTVSTLEGSRIPRPILTNLGSRLRCDLVDEGAGYESSEELLNALRDH